MQLLPRFTLGEVIAINAGIVLTYMLSVLVQSRLELILIAYLASVVATIWMVIRILKDPWSTDKIFDEYFYQDRDDIRRCGKE